MAAKTYLKATLTSLVFLVVLGISGTVQGTIISVDDDGPASFTNIQAAINAAQVGDTVIVADGNYIGYGNRDSAELLSRLLIPIKVKDCR